MNRFCPRFINSQNICICAPIKKRQYVYYYNLNEQNFNNQHLLGGLNVNMYARTQTKQAWKHYNTIIFEMNKKKRFGFNFKNLSNTNHTVQSHRSNKQTSYHSKTSSLSSSLKTIRIELGNILARLFNNFESPKTKYSHGIA